MADVRRFPFAWHVRGTTTDHLVQVRRGRTVREGTGLAFWIRPLSTALSEVPVDDRELTLLFHARTADFQDVSVQATVGYRVVAPAAAARRLDFALDLRSGRWRSRPLDQVAQLLTELAQQRAMDVLAAMPLDDAMAGGMQAIREAVHAGLTSAPRLADTGIGVLDVRVTALRPEPDVERALQTPARERVQQEADRATYERRALAVERERAISENELQSQIELAAREEQLVARRGANERRRATEQAAAARIEAEAQAGRSRLLAEARAETTRLVGVAEADAERARMAAYDGVDRGVLLALALREAAGELPPIGNLTLAPDVVGAALGRLTAGGAGHAAPAAPAPAGADGGR
jgi:regulator of protease activity HflC (stomatin/prohibitin superfamily)